jgi:AcrR family transcriptional regulator
MSRPALTDQQRAELTVRQRSQILGGLAACIQERGYAGTTISQIAAAAKVSKSTVYAHFVDKDDIFLELYSTASDHVIAVIDDAATAVAGQRLDWRAQIRAVLGAYMTAMEAGHEFTRCLLVEAQAVSPRALALRSEVLDRYHPGLAVPSRTLILGVLGGINEYMLHALAGGGALTRNEVADAASELMCCVIAGLSA